MKHPKWNLDEHETHLLLSELTIAEKNDMDKIKKIDNKLSRRGTPKTKAATSNKASIKKTVKELRLDAKGLGIKGYYGKNKKELETAIIEANKKNDEKPAVEANSFFATPEPSEISDNEVVEPPLGDNFDVNNNNESEYQDEHDFEEYV